MGVCTRSSWPRPVGGDDEPAPHHQSRTRTPAVARRRSSRLGDARPWGRRRWAVPLAAALTLGLHLLMSRCLAAHPAAAPAPTRAVPPAAANQSEAAPALSSCPAFPTSSTSAPASSTTMAPAAEAGAEPPGLAAAPPALPPPEPRQPQAACEPGTLEPAACSGHLLRQLNSSAALLHRSLSSCRRQLLHARLQAARQGPSCRQHCSADFGAAQQRQACFSLVVPPCASTASSVVVPKLLPVAGAGAAPEEPVAPSTSPQPSQSSPGRPSVDPKPRASLTPAPSPQPPAPYPAHSAPIALEPAALSPSPRPSLASGAKPSVYTLPNITLPTFSSPMPPEPSHAVPHTHAPPRTGAWALTLWALLLWALVSTSLCGILVWRLRLAGAACAPAGAAPGPAQPVGNGGAPTKDFCTSMAQRHEASTQSPAEAVGQLDGWALEPMVAQHSQPCQQDTPACSPAACSGRSRPQLTSGSSSSSSSSSGAEAEAGAGAGSSNTGPMAGPPASIAVSEQGGGAPFGQQDEPEEEARQAGSACGDCSDEDIESPPFPGCSPASPTKPGGSPVRRRPRRRGRAPRFWSFNNSWEAVVEPGGRRRPVPLRSASALASRWPELCPLYSSSSFSSSASSELEAVAEEGPERGLLQEQVDPACELSSDEPPAPAGQARYDSAAYAPLPPSVAAAALAAGEVGAPAHGGLSPQASGALLAQVSDNPLFGPSPQISAVLLAQVSDNPLWEGGEEPEPVAWAPSQQRSFAGPGEPSSFLEPILEECDTYGGWGAAASGLPRLQSQLSVGAFGMEDLGGSGCGG